MLTAKQTIPVRVLHVVGESRFGGAARIILGLGRIARAEGWQVDILTTDPTFQQAVTQHGFGLVNLDVVRREIRPLWDLRGLLRLVRFLRKERYQIVHTHTSKGGFVGRLAARLAGVPTIVHTIHGFAFHEDSAPSVRRFYSGLEMIASHWCHKIVSVSEFHREWAIQLGMCSPRRIVAIPNGVAEPVRSSEVEAGDLRRRMGAQPGDLLMLTITRLAADKGLEYLMEAMAALPPTKRRLHCAIAGDGPARQTLEQLAGRLGVGDRVTFLGFREDIGDLLAACDLVVLPSLREGLSMSLLEAMAAGKPIVATSIGSQREVASRGEVVCLVRPADRESLKDGILRLVEDAALMTRLGVNARAAYESYYNEERMLQSYRELYAGLAGSPSPDGHEAIRRATPRDLAGIVKLHQTAFGKFFLTKLGGNFLWRYYDLVLNYEGGIVLVSDARQGVQGFACGFLNPADFYGLMWQAKLTFAVPVVSALVRHPSLMGNVLSGIRRIQSTGADWPDQSCELSSIAVAPARAGNGFGKALMEAFVAHASDMGARCVFLTTDAEGNDAVNAFYRNVGFRHTRLFLQGEGRWMNEYVISGLKAGEACEHLH